MYFSRGNPVVYYGDEQGFTGAGGDQDARQDMFPSQSPQYNNLSDPITGDDGAGKNDNIGSDETPMDDNFDPATRSTASSRGWRTSRAVTRRSATAPSSTATRRPPPASTRSRASTEREYVVALNNAEHAASAAVPTFMARGEWEKVYGDGAGAAAQRARQAAERDGRAAVGRRLPRARTASRAAARRRRLARRARRRVATGSRCAPTSPATRSTR